MNQLNQLNQHPFIYICKKNSGSIIWYDHLNRSVIETVGHLNHQTPTKDTLQPLTSAGSTKHSEAVKNPQASAHPAKSTKVARARQQEGKHYLKVTGEELRELKNRPEIIGSVGKRAKSTKAAKARQREIRKLIAHWAAVFSRDNPGPLDGNIRWHLCGISLFLLQEVTVTTW